MHSRAVRDYGWKFLLHGAVGVAVWLVSAVLPPGCQAHNAEYEQDDGPEEHVPPKSVSCRVRP